MNRLRRTLTTFTATLLLTGAGVALPASASAADGVDLYCTDVYQNGLLATGCSAPTQQHPANVNCETVTSGGDPAVVALASLLGITVAPTDIVALTCTTV